MITLIPSAIDPATVQAVQSILAKPVGASSQPPHTKLEQRIVDSLLANRAFIRAALPKRIVRLVFDRYEAGMGCGPRVDDPIMDGCRTDLSFSLFLNDPADYDRGDLIVETNAGWETRKHAAGDLDAALALLDCTKCGVDARLRVQNARANLVRLWLNRGDA